MSEASNQLVTGGFQWSPFAIKPEILQLRDAALANSALIGKVETTAQNEASAAARRQIKSLLSLFESQRKKLKEPILEAGRQLDRIVGAASEELGREDGRLENLQKDFIRAEMRRRAEEEELQRRELERIEREKQAELLRIAREQIDAERKAREAAEQSLRKAREAAAEAQRLADEATNRRQREAAEAARIEAQKQAEAAHAEAQKQTAAAAEAARQQSQLAMEAAEAARLIESKPVELNRARGQSVKKEWVIDQIQDFPLMKARPDLVRKIEWDLVGIKAALAEGITLPGVRAHEDIKVGSRAGKSPAAIDV